MNRDFFSTFEQRKQDFASRTQVEGDVRAELILGAGRAFAIARVIDVADAWVQIDAHDLADLEETPLSLSLAYHQIAYVQFVKPKQKMKKAGFGR